MSLTTRYRRIAFEQAIEQAASSVPEGFVLDADLPALIANKTGVIPIGNDNGAVPRSITLTPLLSGSGIANDGVYPFIHSAMWPIYHWESRVRIGYQIERLYTFGVTAATHTIAKSAFGIVDTDEPEFVGVDAISVSTTHPAATAYIAAHGGTPVLSAPAANNQAFIELPDGFGAPKLVIDPVMAAADRAINFVVGLKT